MSMLDDMLEELRLLSMLSVQKPDGEAFLRKVCRWYSRTFSTALHVVERDLPLEDILRHYYEARYEDMEDEDLAAELHNLLLTPEQRREQARKLKLEEEQKKADDDAFLEMTKTMAETAKKLDPELAKPLTPNQGGPLPSALSPVIGQPPLSSVTTDPALPMKEIPPDIKIEFVDDLGDLDSWDLLGPPSDEPKGKK